MVSVKLNNIKTQYCSSITVSFDGILFDDLRWNFRSFLSLRPHSLVTWWNCQTTRVTEEGGPRTKSIVIRQCQGMDVPISDVPGAHRKQQSLMEDNDRQDSLLDFNIKHVQSLKEWHGNTDFKNNDTPERDTSQDHHEFLDVKSRFRSILQVRFYSTHAKYEFQNHAEHKTNRSS